MDNQLNQIKALMKAGELTQAREQLEQYLKDNPADAQGWYLASFLRPTGEMRLAAIQHAAKLKPDQQDIQARLIKLQSTKPKNRRFPSGVIVAIVVLVVGVVFVSILALRGTPGPSATGQLPTLAVLQVFTNTPSQPSATVETQNVGVTVSPEVTFTFQPPTLTELPLLPSVALSETVSIPQPTLFALSETPFPTVVNAFTTLPASPVNNLPTNNPIAPTQPNVIAPTATPLKPTTSVGPTAIPFLTNAVPLNIAVNLAAGEFRVVDATRGAESMITDLGGTFPPAPANQSWLLVELLLVCGKTTACAFDTSTLKIVGSSGTNYDRVSQLNLIPTFGTITENNQIWGYLGFIIPNNEAQLELTFSQNNQTYVFALQ